MKIEQFLQTTLYNNLKKKQVDEIRVAALIEELGICKATFYKYYCDKYDLLAKTFDRICFDELCDKSKDFDEFIANSIAAFAAIPQTVFKNAFNSKDYNSLPRHYALITYKMLEKQYKPKIKTAEERYAAQRFAESVSRTLIEGVQTELPFKKEDLSGIIKRLTPALFA